MMTTTPKNQLPNRRLITINIATLAMALGAFALVHGAWTHRFLMPFGVGSFGLGIMAGALTLPHGEGELLATLVGVGFVALGHDLNFRARSQR